MKKVLVIVYYWPPSGGGGVQRWVKFSKYLPQLGWEPIIYAPENADYPLRDETLEAELSPDLTVIRKPIFEPRKVFKRLSGQKKGKKTADEVIHADPANLSFFQKLSVWIRGNFFIPDARSFWIRPSVTFLTQYLQEHPVDAIVSTGPPHSLHLIGRALKRKLQIPWLADFRDPWREIEFYDNMMLTRWADKRHQKLERSVIQEASALSVISYYWESLYRTRGGQLVETVTNGYDDKDFPDEPVELNEYFLLSHIGTLTKDRSPLTLWEALQELSREIPEFKAQLRIELTGKVDPAVFQTLSELGLEENVIKGGYVTHGEAVKKMRSTQILLLLINFTEENAQGRMTGKIFEYMASQRPILCIGATKSDPADVLRETGAGRTFEYDDLQGIKKYLFLSFQKYRKGKLTVSSKDYQKFSRRNTAGQIADLLNQITV